MSVIAGFLIRLYTTTPPPHRGKWRCFPHNRATWIGYNMVQKSSLSAATWRIKLQHPRVIMACHGWPYCNDAQEGVGA